MGSMCALVVVNVGTARVILTSSDTHGQSMKSADGLMKIGIRSILRFWQLFPMALPNT